ncbi:MAG: hypothetical protein ACHQFX_20845, partial [Chitinophagales bacterium]
MEPHRHIEQGRKTHRKLSTPLAGQVVDPMGYMFYPALSAGQVVVQNRKTFSKPGSQYFLSFKHLIMKKTFSLLLLASLVISANAQFNAEKTPLITQSLAKDAIKNILTETSGGSISVTGVEAGQAKIEVYVRPNNSKENSLSEKEIRDRMAAEYDLTISASNNKLTAIAKPKDRNMNWKKALNFSFKIFVPKNVSVDLSTSGGSIALTNLSGTLDFKTSGGSLRLDQVSGKIKGRTSGG